VAITGFYKIYSWGDKSGEIWFSPFQIEKTAFFAKYFKSQEGPSPSPSPFPTPMSDSYPNVGKDALKKLLLFPSTYLCESGFSTLLYVKIKNRN